MTGLTVIGHRATRAARVLWLLEEMGLPYTHVPSRPQSSAVREHNPSGKVPVLLVGDVALTDSTAIMTFLADREGRFTAPAGTLDRARQDGLTQAILDEFDAVLWTASRHSFVLPEEMRLPAIKESLRWEYARNQARMAERLGAGPFLMGAEMTIPDLILSHCLDWAVAAKFPAPDPALAAFHDRMRARPAYVRAAAL